MDRATRAAIRLPPVARLTCLAACAVLAVSAFPAPAAARALPPPPQRLAAVWGRQAWPGNAPAVPSPPPGRWGWGWVEGGPLALPVALRSHRGRA